MSLVVAGSMIPRDPRTEVQRKFKTLQKQTIFKPSGQPKPKIVSYIKNANKEKKQTPVPQTSNTDDISTPRDISTPYKLEEFEVLGNCHLLFPLAKIQVCLSQKNVGTLISLINVEVGIGWDFSEKN